MGAFTNMRKGGWVSEIRFWNVRLVLGTTISGVKKHCE